MAQSCCCTNQCKTCGACCQTNCGHASTVVPLPNTTVGRPPAAPAQPIQPVVVTSGQGLWFHTPPLTAEQVRLIVRDELERALAPSVEKAYGGTD